MRLSSALSISILLMAYAFDTNAANNYVSVALPHSVRIEVPGNWEVLSRNQRIMIDSSAQAIVESMGMFDASSDLNFGANLYNEADETIAIINIRYYPYMKLTQVDASAATTADIKDLDRTLKASLVSSGKTAGYSIPKWFGTSQLTINESVTFVTEYERSHPDKIGNFRVRLIRIFNGKNSLTVTISYKSSEGHLLRPICDKIIYSIKYLK